MIFTQSCLEWRGRHVFLIRETCSAVCGGNQETRKVPLWTKARGSAHWAEAAVEGCRPGWFSKERGVEILLRFLKTHCAKLALPDLGSHLQEFFFKLKREQYEPMASLSTRHRNEHTKVRRVIAGSDYLGFGKHGSKTYQAVLKLDPEYC